jgi:hypothetical protein
MNGNMRDLGLSFCNAIGLAIFLSLASIGAANCQVTNNVLLRVLMIRAAHSIGSGFTIEVDDRQYLITAKHVAAGLKSDDTISILKNDGSWLVTNVKVYFCEEPIDIAVLVPETQITVAYGLKPDSAGILFGQDVYLMGFPVFPDGSIFTNMSVGSRYPLAFIRRAIMSAQVVQDGVRRMFFDGHNTEGFSGGPIVFRDLNQPGFEFKVAGVISGYKVERAPVLKRQQISPNEITAEDRGRARVWEHDGQTDKLV